MVWAKPVNKTFLLSSTSTKPVLLRFIVRDFSFNEEVDKKIPSIRRLLNH